MTGLSAGCTFDSSTKVSLICKQWTHQRINKMNMQQWTNERDFVIISSDRVQQSRVGTGQYVLLWSWDVVCTTRSGNRPAYSKIRSGIFVLKWRLQMSMITLRCSQCGEAQESCINHPVNCVRGTLASKAVNKKWSQKILAAFQTRDY